MDARKELQREFEAYQRLPSPHPRLVRSFGFSAVPDGDGEQGLVLEYMPNGNLKAALEAPDADISVERRMQWCIEAAEAVVLVHSHGIIHTDIKPENMLLDEALRVRLIDFAGAAFDGKPPLTCEITRFALPVVRNRFSEVAACSVPTDLFALGSSIYQIVTGKAPYADIASREVEARYTKKEFPPVNGILFGDVIRKCWMCEFESAAEVLKSLTAEKIKNLQ
jgi:serine/threonine protein kinase